MTAIEKIIAWANDKKRTIWWRHAIRLILENQKLNQTHHEILYNIARMEMGLDSKDESFDPYYSSNVSSSGFIAEEKSIALIKLSSINNVNALTAQGNGLSFCSRGLTIIYGDNGSGKSSYSRILKNACLTRGDRPEILGNIFTLNNTIPSATITFQAANEEPQEKYWEYKTVEINELKSIRIFDNTSAIHYVEKEGAIEYRPAGLHILDELIIACDYIGKKVSIELQAISSCKGLPTVDINTTASNFLNSLNAKTKNTEINNYCITQEEIIELTNLKQQLSELRHTSPEVIKKELNRKIDSITPLIEVLKTAASITSEENKRIIEDLKLDYKNKSHAAELARYRAFSNLPFQTIGGHEWQVLWKAAKDFIEKEPGEKKFPTKTSENCPLCLQEISENTSNRMKEFESYVQNSTQEQLNTAKDLLASKINEINIATLNLAPYQPIIVELNDTVNEIKAITDKFEENFNARKKYLITIENDTTTIFPTMPLTAIEKLTDYKTKLETQLKQIKDDTALEKQIITLAQRESELEARKKIAENKTLIVAEVDRLIKKQQCELIKKSCTDTNSITLLSSNISKDYVTNKLCEYFLKELAEFGFTSHKVEAATRGQKGIQLLKIKLSTSQAIDINKIASEGEKKCLALASFLAEIKADERTSGVIFDDPVNSLDHHWSRKIAERLINEALSRQVIIFTHNITFLKFLLEISEEKQNPTPKILSLDRKKTETGLVRNNPPWDALTTSKRIQYLNVLLRKLKKIDKNGTENEYKEQAYHFYGYLREAWERLVEERLLNQVVTRFGREIKTQRLSKIIDISDSDIQIINESMKKCSTYFKGHDSAPEIHCTMPSINEIIGDIKKIHDFEQELVNKRRRN